jgi:tetratricopeptide (TPR) repeat protein
MATPEPIATGTLAKTPLPHLLVYLDQKKLSGTLALWPDDTDSQTGQDRVLLLKGRPVAARLMRNATALRDGLLPLFARRQAPYAFYEGNLLGDDRVSGRVDPLALIMDALRGGYRPDVVALVLDRFGNAKLRMQPGVELERYELTLQERVIVDIVRAEPADVASLVHASGLSEELARGVLYALAINKAIAPHVPSEASLRPPRSSEPSAVEEPGSGPPGKPASMPPPVMGSGDGMGSSPPGAMHQRLDRLNSIPPPPDTLDDALKQRWLKVIAKGRLMENQNYFEMLEVDKDTKSADARNKFYQLAKEWHPDRLPQDLSPLREFVQIIFSYMSEASTALSDEESRMKYVQTVREGGGTPATDKLMQSILDMAMEYERVLVMARRHQFDEALELLKRILSAVKDEPDYHAMHAWLLQQKFPGKDAPLAKILESADAALALHPTHEKANMLKAQVLRKMGKPNDALEYFKKVADMNPNNIEAVREVRVATMRGAVARKKRQEQESSPVSGLLGKFFKKK